MVNRRPLRLRMTRRATFRTEVGQILLLDISERVSCIVTVLNMDDLVVFAVYRAG
jgi:hypothetical protein